MPTTGSLLGPSPPCFRTLLKQVQNSGGTHLVVDCSAENIYQVLKQAQQVGMVTRYYHFFFTNLVSPATGQRVGRWRRAEQRTFVFCGNQLTLCNKCTDIRYKFESFSLSISLNRFGISVPTTIQKFEAYDRRTVADLDRVLCLDPMEGPYFVFSLLREKRKYGPSIGFASSGFFSYQVGINHRQYQQASMYRQLAHLFVRFG